MVLKHYTVLNFSELEAFKKKTCHLSETFANEQKEQCTMTKQKAC